MKKLILFQGESITDAGRDRDNPVCLGMGYPSRVAGALGVDRPNDFDFLNRGISGNRIVDIYARIKWDFINLKPDYASIFVGVNDAWHEIEWQNGVEDEKFEKIYGMMIEEVQAACPAIRLMLISPFVLEGWATKATEEQPDRWDRFQTDVAAKAVAVRHVAEKYNLPLIELQPIFDAACEQAPAEHWSADGVHPTPAGHELIKRAWLEAFEYLE